MLYIIFAYMKSGFFKSLFGFHEVSYGETQKLLLDMASFHRKNDVFASEKCVFRIGETDVDAGFFSMPSVAELRDAVKQRLAGVTSKPPTFESHITVKNIVGEARSLHSDPLYDGAVIQCASQFNMLEFPSPRITPEAGITNYEADRTQGPACAMACAAGTAYRNYLVPLPFHKNVSNPKRGQTKSKQLNGLVDIEEILARNHSINDPWLVKNGYIESSTHSLEKVNVLIENDPLVRQQFVANLRVGIQEDSCVTDLPGKSAKVTQVYCSAMSVGYSQLPPSTWEPIARLVLDATYEATLLTAVLKSFDAKEKRPVLLTKVGGGVFGNSDEWIIDAMQKAIESVIEFGVALDISIVHFRETNKQYDCLER